MLEPPRNPANTRLTAAGRVRILPDGPGLAGRPRSASRSLSWPPFPYLPTLPCRPR